ncbi:MAG: monovalent cation/H+ antiporter subunit D family protein [Gemmatimonadota bacterium]
MGMHLPALQVVIPLMAAGFALLAWRPRLSWTVAMAASIASFLISAQLLRQVLADGPISYNLGGWEPPWGIEYRIDALNAFVLFLVSLIAVVVTPFALRSVEQEIAAPRIPFFYAAWLLALAGLLGIAITGDLFNVFVFLEISSLAAYALISMGSDRRALSAAFRYLIVGSVGATFIVIGIGYLYVMTGTLNMADLAGRLPDVADQRPVIVGFAFLAVGICLKLALFPLHLWLPNAYTYAPSAATPFIAATYTKVAVYMLLRVFFTVFGESFSFDLMRLDAVILPLALIGIVSMSLVAIFQPDLKRMLAYSSVAQIGYMILGISFGSVTGLTAATLHMFNHAIMKGALFMAVGCMVYRLESSRIEDLAGVGRRMPLTMGAFLIGGLSIIGVPLTAGFISKWYLVLGAIERGWWPVAAVVLFGSLLAVIYIWRIVEVAYFRAPADGTATERVEAPLLLLVPTWILALANLYFGIDASLTTSAASAAASAVLGGGP